MKRTLFLPAIFALLAFAVGANCAEYSSFDRTPAEKKALEEQKNIFEEILNLYARESLERPGDLADCAREMFAMRSNKRCRDEFSKYLTPEEYQRLEEYTRGEYGGVGMLVEENENSAFVVASVAEGSPAERAGIKAGDVIVSVKEAGGREAEPRSAEELVRLIRGKIGTFLEIKVKRGGAVLKFSLARQRIEIVSVEVSPVPGRKNAAVVKINLFSENTRSKFRQEMKRLKKNGVNEVVLDLRNNPGGLLWETLEILTYFMKAGDTAIIFKTRNYETVYDGGRLAVEAGIYEPEFGVFRDMRVAVLINKKSASASEIFAGTMKDWGYKVVGEKSFGKGVGQTLFLLSDGSALALTTFEILVGNGRTSIRNKGVVPDIEVKNTDEKTDLQLRKALEILRTP